jgi:hypothetical protein
MFEIKYVHVEQICKLDTAFREIRMSLFREIR